MIRACTLARHSFFLALPLLWFVWILGVPAHGQPASGVGQLAITPKYVPGMSSYETAPGTGVLVFHLFADQSGVRLVGPARIDVTNLSNHVGVFQTIEGDGEGVFVNLPVGDYEIEASALGYLTARQKVLVVTQTHTEPTEIVLERDPTAVKLELTASDLSPKARKEAKSGLSLLKAGFLADAEKDLEKAYKLAPSNSDLNFLLGYDCFQQRQYQQAATYLGTAASLSPHNGQALTLLGRADLALGNNMAAKSALEKAVLADDDNWLPHNLLADTYLLQKDYAKARDEALTAIAKGQRMGKGVAAAAQVVLGEALVGLGKRDDAIQAFNAFLTDSPQNPLASQIRALVAQLQKHAPGPAPAANGASANAETANANPASADNANPDAPRADALAAVPAPELSTRSWRPLDVDDARPTMTPGIPCPTARVMDEAGRRVKAFVQDLSRFAADEDLFHQSIDAFGVATHTETRKYDYTAIVSEPQPGAVSIAEFRSDKRSQEGYPDGMQSTGFVMLGMVFHPDMQKDFQFDCEGQTDWHGQPSWVVHFRQRPDRPNRMHSYYVGTQEFPVALKGRAFIRADQSQIVRIEADMENPVQPIQLLSEHQVVEYGAVPFPKKKTTLWLPKTAEIYIDFHKRHYYRRHSFSHYLLFSVETGEQRKEPVAKPSSEVPPTTEKTPER